MADLKTQLMEDLKNAMRSGETVKRDTIRFLMSSIKNFEIDNGAQDDAGILKLIAKELKQINESIAEYGAGGRQDLVDAEKPKAEILQAYLPQQMSDEDLKAKLEPVVTANAGANFGELMKAAMPAVAGQADGKRVSEMLKTLMK
jgi:uncharacterized protein